MKKLIFPTVEEIVSLNRLVIENSPIKETHAVLNKSSIEFLVERISNMKNVWDAAAKILIGFIEAHAFAEGNKRTALLAMQTFLWENGHKFNINKTELEFVYRIAQGKEDFEEVREWIKNRCAKK